GARTHSQRSRLTLNSSQQKGWSSNRSDHPMPISVPEPRLPTPDSRLTPPRPRREIIPQPVPQQDQAHYREHQGQAREGEIPPGHPEIGPSPRDHRPPLRRGRLRAKTDERETRRRQHREPNIDRALNDDRRNRIRQDVA